MIRVNYNYEAGHHHTCHTWRGWAEILSRRNRKERFNGVRGVDSDRRERWSTGSKRRRYDTVVKVCM